MAARGVIVRRLNAIENFGSMDVLCTDKTGTLTEGVVRLDGALDGQGQPSEAVLRAAYLNARFQTGLSNPLDDAIVAAARLRGVESAADHKVDEIPYDFTRKRLSVVTRDGAGQTVLISKGALDHVLAVCSRVQHGALSVPLDDTRRDELQRRAADWGTQGVRVLGVATKLVDPQPQYTREDERDLVFAGFLLCRRRRHLGG
jgi:Mg2+-importing ATPase